MSSHEAPRVGPVQPSLRNLINHAGGGNDVVPKPLFSPNGCFGAITADKARTSPPLLFGFGGGKRRARAEVSVGRLTLASSLVSQVKEMAL